MPPEVPVLDAEPKPYHIEVGHYGAQLASHPDALRNFGLIKARSDAQGCDRVREGRGHRVVSFFAAEPPPRYAAARMLSIPIPDSRCASRSLDMRFSYDLGGWFGRGSLRRLATGFFSKAELSHEAGPPSKGFGPVVVIPHPSKTECQSSSIQIAATYR